MLNRKIFVGLVISLLTCSAIPMHDFVAQSDQVVSIISPGQGDVLSGVVNINGTTELSGFVRSELAFSYAEGSTETWFPISESIISVEAGLLTTWDTMLISDGDYQLRLRVISEDNSVNEFKILISVRNYTPTAPVIPTSIVFVDPTATILSSTETPVLLPTALPENPLVLSPQELTMSLIYGFLTIFGLIVISSIYSRLRPK